MIKMLRQQTNEQMEEEGYTSPFTIFDESDVRYKPVTILLVVAKNVEQAKLLWKEIRSKYQTDGQIIRFVSNEPIMLDGLSGLEHEGMTIICVGEYWLNKSYGVIEGFKRLGSKVIYEEGELAR